MDDGLETGSCFCGAIAMEFHGAPFWCCFDHDDDCRKAVGGPVNLWVGFRPQQVRPVCGTPKTFGRTPGVTRTFCRDCGTSIGYCDVGLPDEVYITAGFLDHPERLKPQAHAYWRLRLPCVVPGDDLPRLDAGSRTREPAIGIPASRPPPAAVLTPPASPASRPK